jgi:hypothetical protein
MSLGAHSFPVFNELWVTGFLNFQLALMHTVTLCSLLFQNVVDLARAHKLTLPCVKLGIIMTKSFNKIFFNADSVTIMDSWSRKGNCRLIEHKERANDVIHIATIHHAVLWLLFWDIHVYTTCIWTWIYSYSIKT